MNDEKSRLRTIRVPTRRKPSQEDTKLAQEIVRRLSGRAIIMVGLMGCGKSSVGKRIAQRLDLPFIDADDEIEKRAGQSVEDIFVEHGEAFFRDREKLVIASLLDAGPVILATGGGAFLAPETRKVIKSAGVSVWLRAELPVLMRRVMRRDNRPLLKTDDPEAVMRDLIATRYPVYADADITIESRDVPHDVIVKDVLEALAERLVRGGRGGKRKKRQASGTAQAPGR